MSFVLDTNVVPYHLAGRLVHPLPPGPLLLSIVTEIELLSFKQLSATENAAIQRFLTGVTVLPLDDSLKAITISLRLSGLRLPDAVVAATAVGLDVELLTNDARLLKVPGLKASAPLLK